DGKRASAAEVARERSVVLFDYASNLYEVSEDFGCRAVELSALANEFVIGRGNEAVVVEIHERVGEFVLEGLRLGDGGLFVFSVGLALHACVERLANSGPHVGERACEIG